VGKNIANQQRCRRYELAEGNKAAAFISRAGSNNVRDPVFMGIADYPVNAGQGGEFLGSALGVASRHQDAAGRILAMEAANGGARVAVGRRGYGAGIKDDNIGELRAGANHSLGAQLAIYNRAIGLGGPASEVLNVKAGHGDIITAEFSGPDNYSVLPDN